MVQSNVELCSRNLDETSRGSCYITSQKEIIYKNMKRQKLKYKWTVHIPNDDLGIIFVSLPVFWAKLFSFSLGIVKLDCICIIIFLIMQEDKEKKCDGIKNNVNKFISETTTQLIFFSFYCHQHEMLAFSPSIDDIWKWCVVPRVYWLLPNIFHKLITYAIDKCFLSI